MVTMRDVVERSSPRYSALLDCDDEKTCRRRMAFLRAALFLFALAALLIAVVAAGQEPPPPAPVPEPTPPARVAGGCTKGRLFCAGPSAVAGLVAYSFKSQEFTTGLMTGVCYGGEVWPDVWHTVGVDFCANIQTGGSTPTTGLFSLPLSFAEYVRLGPALRVVGADREWMLVGALGVNF